MGVGAAWRRVERTVDRPRERSHLADHVFATIGARREPDLFEDEQPGPHWRAPA